MLTAYHWADDDRVFYKEARSLAKHGADVVIVCPDRKPPPDNTDGVQFVTFPTPAGWRQRIWGIRQLEGLAAAERYDVVHCHEPDSLYAGLRARRRTGGKVIFDSHENWGGVLAVRLPQTVRRLGESAFQAWERRLIRQCDGGIGATWPISDYLCRHLPSERVATILNAPVPEVFGETAERTWGDTTVLIHDGHLGFGRGLKTMVKATHHVSHKHKVRLRIVGDVFGAEREWLDGYVAQHGLQDIIERTGWLAYDEVGKNIALGHIGLIAFQRDPNNAVSLPNKLFNYLLYGLPFIAPDFAPTYQRIVSEDRCGLLADSASVESYAQTIAQMIEHRDETLAMGRRAIEASRTKYRWEHMETELVRLYLRCLGRQQNAGHIMDPRHPPVLR